jgi:crotonobetainyl-CoA:carnitine CoA-transferase CaiB-like acyl-CoA transferase
LRGEKANMQALDQIISTWTRGYDVLDLAEMLEGAAVPSSRVYTIADIFEDPHYRARGMLASVPHPELGDTTQIGVVPRLSRTPGAIRFTGPELGSDTRAVLQKELGLDGVAVDELIEAGVVKAGE